MDLLTQSIGIPDGMAGWQVLQKSLPTSFGAFMADPVLKSNIAYFEANAPKAATAQQLLSDPRLQDFVLTAFGLSSENGLTGLMTKVLNSDPSDANSFASQLVSPAYANIAKAFDYANVTSTPAVPAVASGASVTLDDFTGSNSFESFSGSFAGITLQNVDLTGDTSRQDIAATLTKAFQNADGGRSDITVTVSGLNLQFSDAQGRGTATSFDWTTDSGSTGIQPTASATANLVQGSQAQAATGGPNVTNPTFINQVVALYTEAQFQTVVGNTSNTLRTALYAQQQLPNITNWYSVIADTNLASVVQTVLGLPSSFGTLNVDQQAAMLQSKMNITDFQNPTKLTALLNQYVAIGSASDSSSSGTSSSPAVQLLSSLTGSSSGVGLNLTGLNFSSGSAAALLLST